MIVAEDLTKAYANQKAIDRVNFEIEEGEIVGLLGLNGAGKSTVLKILGCFLLPSAGTARVAGFSVDENPEEIRKRIGYLPDAPPLYDEMTVERYLSYVARLKNVSSAQIRTSVDKALDKTNITDVRRARLGELSHGYRQRVGIAQALVHDPKVLILDEPINGLDPVQIVEMRDLITSFKGEHTVILSSHILSEITRTCDRILIVDQGRLVAEGTEQDLRHDVTRQMRLTCDVSGETQELEAALRSLSGVVEVETSSSPEEKGVRLRLVTDGDLRTEVARRVVESGCGLLGLHKDDAGLEALFMKLVQSSGEGKAVG